MKRILVLGAGIMQMPAIRIAKSRGWRVIVADGNARAEGRDLCDRFENVDLRDSEGLLALARQCAASGGLDGVFTAGTDFSTSVAYVAEKMGLPGIPYETALRATDKAVMREAFARAGVPSPRFAAWEGEGSPRDAVRGFAFPVVVKPVDNMGARGVRRADDPQALESACREALPLSRSGRVIVEEFMEGPELSLDAVVYRGEATVCGIADRHIFFPPYFVELGHTMPTALGEKVEREAAEVFRAGIRALGIVTGAAKGDIKVTPRGVMIGEIAARLSGGYMSGWTFPLSSGVDVTGAALNVAVGLPPGSLVPPVRRVSAERAFISMPGVVRAVEGVDGARAAAGVSEVFLRTGPGAEAVFPRNNVEKCGNVITVAETRADAVEAARRAIAGIVVRLEPLEERTEEFLRGAGPTAFALAHAENLAALECMPAWQGGLQKAAEGARWTVLPLPSLDSETCVDWHGLQIQEAAARGLAALGAQWAGAAPADGVVLGRVFWNALLRGSLQGALYLADSLRAAAERGRLAEYLRRT